MAVTFTPNVGLAEAELAEKWVNVDQLQNDNNIIITDKSDVNLVTYTPVLVGQTTAPQVGAGGSSRGEWQEFQGFIFGSFNVEFGAAGLVVGSGEYGISLPVPIDNAYHNVSSALNASIGSFACLGEGYIFDNSNVSLSGTCALDAVTIAGVSYVRMVLEQFSVPAKTARVFRDAMPSTVATGDTWLGSFCYKKL